MGSDIGDLFERREAEFTHLRGQTVAIDAYNTIYQFLSSIRQLDGTPLNDSHGRVTSRLSWLLYRTTNLIEAKQPDINRPGLAHIAFAVDDVEITAKRVISNGGSQLGEIFTEHIPKSGMITFVCVRDPEGNIIGLQN